MKPPPLVGERFTSIAAEPGQETQMSPESEEEAPSAELSDSIRTQLLAQQQHSVELDEQLTRLQGEVARVLKDLQDSDSRKDP